MVMNEAHAWVEVFDGSLWRRIDLGGAGRTLLNSKEASEVPYAPPPDPFAWPPDAERGGDLARRAGPAAPSAASARGSEVETRAPSSTTSATPAARIAPHPAASATGSPEGRSAATVTLEVVETDSRRGEPLHVRGQVQSGADPCPRALVLVELRDARAGARLPLGALATDDSGAFSGVLVVPRGTPVGDYEVIAHTPGGPGCPE
jgi:hypothetical protein